MSLRTTDVWAVGEVATASLLWRMRGRLHLTVVAKAGYALVSGKRMQRAKAPPVLEQDLHFDEQPTRSMRLPSDAVPYLSQADVLFTGHAHTPMDKPLPMAEVRLALHGSEALVDKRLHVYGERSNNVTLEPGAFSVMPMRYERALRDRSGELNPVGVEPDKIGMLPNIVTPGAADEPAGLGPLSRYWRCRRDRVASRSRALLSRRIVEIPSGFDWSYFQAAPADQRCHFLGGDEWLVLEGLDSRGWLLRCQLPGERASVWVWPRGGTAAAGHGLRMVADTLLIDGDAHSCTLVWRGSFPIENEEQLAALRIGVGVEHPQEPIDWNQEALRIEVDQAELIDAELDLSIDPSGTITVERPAKRVAIDDSAATIARAPQNADDQNADDEDADDQGADDQGADDEDELAHTVAIDRSPLAAAGAAEDPLAGTLGLSDQAPRSLGAPFPLPTPTASAPVAELVPAPIPGAPWCPGDVAPVPAIEDPLAGTLQLSESAAARLIADEQALEGPLSLGLDRSALRAEVSRRLRQGEPLSNLDLSGADLSGLLLSGQSLAGSVLDGASLVGAQLLRCNLAGARLSNADLSGAKLDGATLDDADLRGALLQQASLRQVLVHSANLAGADGRDADLRGAAGYKASFAGGNWQGARFDGAQLDQADFGGATLDNVVFDEAALREASFERARAQRTSLRHANLMGASAARSLWVACDMERMFADGSRWDDAVLDDSRLVDASFESASLARASFRRVDLSGTPLDRADVSQAVFEGARRER